MQLATVVQGLSTIKTKIGILFFTVEKLSFLIRKIVCKRTSQDLLTSNKKDEEKWFELGIRVQQQL